MSGYCVVSSGPALSIKRCLVSWAIDLYFVFLLTLYSRGRQESASIDFCLESTVVCELGDLSLLLTNVGCSGLSFVHLSHLLVLIKNTCAVVGMHE